ncbi:Hypothetical predicted protein [Podarcis lilfordi]|uniref:Uncharacterized protein n=1 Tax=Podarcis lilfordi TaxID=74358 RepID=A0AA35KH61_9SAUR|nr:Hypothetical predicted protein [Podarcis lilfordi]
MEEGPFRFISSGESLPLEQPQRRERHSFQSLPGFQPLILSSYLPNSLGDFHLDPDSARGLGTEMSFPVILVKHLCKIRIACVSFSKIRRSFTSESRLLNCLLNLFTVLRNQRLLLPQLLSPSVRRRVRRPEYHARTPFLHPSHVGS